MPSDSPSAADAEGLLEQMRRRTAKLLADLTHDQSEWESADIDQVVKKKGQAALDGAVTAAEQLSKAIDADCPMRQGRVDQENEGNPDE